MTLVLIFLQWVSLNLWLSLGRLLYLKNVRGFRAGRRPTQVIDVFADMQLE